MVVVGIVSLEFLGDGCSQVVVMVVVRCVVGGVIALELIKHVVDAVEREAKGI